MIRLVAVIILLLIPTTDWLTPGLCPEDLQGMPMLAVMDQNCVGQSVTSLTLAQQEHHPEKSSSPLEDECFCCCHHVVPQLIFISPDDKSSVEVTPEALTDLMSPAGDPPYHPPSFS